MKKIVYPPDKLVFDENRRFSNKSKIRFIPPFFHFWSKTLAFGTIVIAKNQGRHCYHARSKLLRFGGAEFLSVLITGYY